MSKKQPPKADRIDAARLLADFLKENKIVLQNTSQIVIGDKFKNLVPQQVLDAVNVGMLTTKATVTAKYQDA